MPRVPLNTYLTRLIWLCIAPLVLLSAYLSIDYVLHEHAEFDAEAARLTRNVAATISLRLRRLP